MVSVFMKAVFIKAVFMKAVFIKAQGYVQYSAGHALLTLDDKKPTQTRASHTAREQRYAGVCVCVSG